MPDTKRTRRRRTFTMEDESYERLTRYANAAHANRSRFLEHLLLMAEPILAWEPPRRRWWQFWVRKSRPLMGVIDADHTRQLKG